MPQRHSRNNNDLAIFTYEEKRKLGYGTQRERIGKDSIKPFDACCLCLKPLIEPLCCKKGHLYCKECIYSCLLQQKKDIKKKLSLYEMQKEQEKEEIVEKLKEEEERKLELFDKLNNSAVRDVELTSSSLGRGSSSSFQGANSVKSTSFEEEAVRTMKAYWLPSATPQAPAKFEAPSTDTICPEGSEKIRLKDLFAVHFKEVPDASSKKISTERFMCPSCSSTLTNVSKLAVVSTCGHVLCKKCVDKFVLKDKACVVCSKSCKSKEVIELQQGGTGFSAHGDNVVAVSFKHLGSGTGAAYARPTPKV